MVRNYETVFIMTPVLADDIKKSTVKKYTDFLKKNGAKIINDEDWGLKQLAYPIQKKKSGFYHLVEFEAEGSIVEELEREYKRDETIIRFLVIKLDKHALAYNEKRKSGAFNKSSKKEKA